MSVARGTAKLRPIVIGDGPIRQTHMNGQKDDSDYVAHLWLRLV
jgi:hypothetical protein